MWWRDPLKNFGGSNHITGTAEPKVVKLCTPVGYINASNRMTYQPRNGRGYGHVTVYKFGRLPRCSASRGFVSDSKTTCINEQLPAAYPSCIALSSKSLHFLSYIIICAIFKKYAFVFPWVCVCASLILCMSVSVTETTIAAPGATTAAPGITLTFTSTYCP